MGITGCGYVVVHKDGHHRADKNGFVYEHVLVAEEKIGRDLNPEEVVHHTNHIRNDNRPENIMVFATKADHSRFHRIKEKIEACDVDKDGVYSCSESTNDSSYKKYKEQIELNHCRICGREIDPKADLCRECHLDFIRQNWPTREYLKREVRLKSFEEIGREFDVCGKTVSKWCKSYHLPYKKSEIKNYTDGEWENEIPYEIVLDRIEKDKPQKFLKKVEQLDIATGEVLNTYESTVMAKTAMGLARTTDIVKACDGRLKTCKGFKWRYKYVSID